MKHRRDRGEEHGMKRYARGLRDEEAQYKAHREHAKSEAHRLAKAAGGTFYENVEPPPVGGRSLQVVNPAASEMAHHFEDAE